MPAGRGSPYHSLCAYVPDLPGCVAAGDTKEEVMMLIHEAIELHLESLKADGKAVPSPTSSIEFIEVASLQALAK